jgi:hypothetical protein
MPFIFADKYVGVNSETTKNFNTHNTLVKSGFSYTAQYHTCPEMYTENERRG